MTSAFAPLVPVNTAVMAGLLGQEQLTHRIVTGMAMALCGTFSLLHVETLGDQLTTDRTGGILVLLFQNWTYAAYLVSLKHIMHSLPFPVGVYFGACAPCVHGSRRLSSRKKRAERGAGGYVFWAVGYVFGWLFLVLISLPYLVHAHLAAVPAKGDPRVYAPLATDRILAASRAPPIYHANAPCTGGTQGAQLRSQQLCLLSSNRQWRKDCSAAPIAPPPPPRTNSLVHQSESLV